tara:strand:- start:176 stop:295 length:120 start_codon:yes stop_codon:yes gene_type:complete
MLKRKNQHLFQVFEPWSRKQQSPTIIWEEDKVEVWLEEK